MKKMFWLFGLVSLLVLAGCGDRGERHPEAHDRGHDGVVAWPLLTQIDEAYVAGQAALAGDDLEAARAALEKIGGLVKQVVEQGAPEKVHHPQAVRSLLQEDLASLMQGVDVAALDAKGVEDLLHGVHHVVAKLMEEAGVPHVHGDGHDDHEGHEGHGHEGHEGEDHEGHGHGDGHDGHGH